MSFNGFSGAVYEDSLILNGSDAQPLPGAVALRYGPNTNQGEISNNGSTWQVIGAGSVNAIAAGTNISVQNIGSNDVISTIASPVFTDITLGGNSVLGTINTVNANLDQAVKTTSSPSFVAINVPQVNIGSAGNTEITDQQIKWPSGLMSFVQNAATGLQIGTNAVYMKNINSLGAGLLNLADNMTCASGVLIDGRDISVDGSNLDTVIGTVAADLDQAVKTTSSPTFAAVNTPIINSIGGITSTTDFISATCDDIYSSTGGFRFNGYSDNGSAITSGSRMGIVTMGAAVNSSAGRQIGTYIESKTTEAWTPTANGSKLVLAITPNGSTTKTDVLTIDQNSSSTFVGPVTWKNSMATLTNLSTDPCVQSADPFHIVVAGSDQLNVSGTATKMRALNALVAGTGLIANNLVISSTGTAVTGGLKTSGTDLQYHNGTTWVPANVIAGLGLSYSGNTLNVTGSPSFAGRITCAGIDSTVSSSAVAAGNFVNNNSTSCTSIWSLASSLATGNNVGIFHGVSGTGSYNASIIQFNYNATGSSSNTLGLGFFGANNRWTLDGLGNTIQTGYNACAQLSAINSTNTAITATITNNGAGASSIPLSITCPNITTGQKAETYFGRDLSLGNAMAFDFNYIGPAASNNTYSMGFYGFANCWSMDRSGSTSQTGSVSTSQLLSTSTGASPIIATNNGTLGSRVFSGLMPNLNTGQIADICFGRDSGTNNSAIMAFNYSSSGSASNSIGIGFQGALNKLTIDTAGNCVATGNITSNGYVGTNKITMPSAVFKFYPTAGSTGSDIYLCSDPAEQTTLQISPIVSLNTTYIKSKVAGGTIMFQDWVGGNPTAAVTIDDAGVTISRLAIGTAQGNATGSLSVSGTDLQYYNGSVWRTLQTSAKCFNTYSCEIYMVNSSGTINASAIGPFLGSTTYSAGMGGSNAYVEVVLPGTVNSSYFTVTWSVNSGVCNTPVQIRNVLFGPNTIRFYPRTTNTGDQNWLSYVMPANTDYISFTFTIFTGQ